MEHMFHFVSLCSFHRLHCTLSTLGESSVLQLEMFNTLDVCIHVDNSSFSREMMELSFKSCLQ